MPLRKKVGYVGLKDFEYAIRDTDAISRDYFNIVEFPSRFTAGKNLFKLKAQIGNLVDQSEIYIEILDFNGNPIYYEPINYIEKDGTRVIAVYIYPDTSPGIATVYLAGRARVNTSDGTTIPFSRDVNDTNYYNIPNILWQRNVTVAPKARNNTEIIFTQYPRVTLTEVIQPYQQPVDILNILTVVTASGASLTITPLPLSSPAGATGLSSVTTAEGSGTGNTPNFGLQFYDIGTVSDSLSNSNALEADAPPLYSLNGASKLTTVGFPLNANMVGGIIEIRNPNITTAGTADAFGNPPQFKTAGGELYPASQASEFGNFFSLATAGQTLPLSGSYRFAITYVQNSTTARVAQYSGFKNTDDNTFGPFNVQLVTQAGTSANIGTINTSTNFTASYIQPITTVQTQRSSSFADLILANIEPATGDVYKIKTLYKPTGFFGDFIDLGDTILEQPNLLIDTGSLETNITVGVAYEAFGAFENLAEIQQYWTTSSFSPSVWQPFTYDDTILVGGAKLNLDYSDIGTGTGPQLYIDENEYANFSIKPEYQPYLYEGTEYIVRFNIANDSDADNIFSLDPNIPNHRMDVYVSGSRIETQEQFRFAQAGDILPVPNINATLLETFRDNGPLGSRIGTYQVRSIPEALSSVEFRFKALDDGPVDLKFVIRNGHFIIGDIEFLANKETGFSPNFTRIFKRIPSEHYNTPLTFKFQYFDYTGVQADLESVVYGAVFDGDNTYIQGTNNLITGSVFISNEIGTGLEMAGTNSGHIRSANFLGINKAMAGTGSAAGILFYSGSILKGLAPEFIGGGIGFQAAASTEKYIRVSSENDDITIKTPGFTFSSRKGSETAASVTGSLEVSGGIILNGYARFNPVTTNINTSVSASYIYVSGSTNDLYFSQNGSGYSNTTRLRWLEGNLYTGLLHGGLITSQSSTMYQVSSGSGIIVNLNASFTADPFPTIQYLQWNNLSASIAPLSASYDQSFVAIDNTGNITAQGTPYTDGDFNTKIPIGVVLHQNHSSINGSQTYASVAYGWKQRSSDFVRAFGPMKLSGMALSVSGSSTGSLVVSSGIAFSDGRNYTVDPNNPSYITDTGTSVSKIFRYHQSGSDWVYNTNNGLGFGAIDPSQYSNSGILTSVPTNHWTIQRVYWFPNSVTKGIYVYYGNAHYATQLEAVAAIETESFTEAPNTAAQALFLGYMILRHNANFTTAASYQLIQGGMFRGGGSTAGGGGATSAGGNPTEIQYNNSGVFGGVPTLTYDGTTLRATGSFSGSLVGTATSASYVLQAISASFATSASFSKTLAASLINDGTGLKLLNSDGSTISNISELTASLAIMASTASFVRGLQQTLSVGNLTSTPSTENTLNVYPPIISNTGEGGQILLAASGGLYTSASMLDTYQNQFRVLKGTNTGGSTVAYIITDLHTGNTQFAGTVTAAAYVGLPNDYLYVTRNTSQTIGSGTWANRDIIFNNSVVSNGISYDTSTGLASLIRGKVYRITARLAWTAAAAYLLQFSCYDSSNNQIGPTVEIVQATNTSNNINDATLDFIYAPGSNIDIKIRTTNNTTALTGESIRGDLNTQLIIQQIA